MSTVKIKSLNGKMFDFLERRNFNVGLTLLCYADPMIVIYERYIK